ncbi:MAG: FixH family protein, partial [Afipia sp.]|nr:FixH family protein [Afipia sp.]
MNRSTIPGRPITGRTVLVAMVAFFAVVIGVNMLMMKLAIDTLPGTDVDSAYRASLAYESEIKAAHDQNLREWQVNVPIERHADGQATLRVDAHDKSGVPLRGLVFSGRLERPTDKRADRLIVLAEGESGTYRGSTSDVTPGQWDLVLESDTAGK